MPENNSESVAVIFRKGDHFIVPPEPLRLPYEPRMQNESFEHAAIRLAIEHGVREVQYNRPLVVPKTEEAPGSAFVFTDPKGQLDESIYFVHEDELVDHVSNHRTLRPVDRALFKIALNRFDPVKWRHLA